MADGLDTTEFDEQAMLCLRAMMEIARTQAQLAAALDRLTVLMTRVRLQPANPG